MRYHVLYGETIALRAVFRGFEGGFIDPTDITLTITDAVGEVLLDTNITLHYQHSPGTYVYEYVTPSNRRGQLTYEFKGIVNGNPIIIRDIIDLVSRVENVTEPTLYGY
jgi:hypothetical protein